MRSTRTPDNGTGTGIIGQVPVISGIHHASLLVADTARSLAFYCDLLGLERDLARPDLGFSGAWLWLGRQQIHLIELPDPCEGATLPEHGGRDRHIAVIVKDVNTLAGRLDRSGVHYTHSRSGRRALFCRDPDGNALEFVEIS
jgi:glyoxylase I family protein